MRFACASTPARFICASTPARKHRHWLLKGLIELYMKGCLTFSVCYPLKGHTYLKGVKFLGIKFHDFRDF